MAKSVPATVSGAGLITGFWSALEKARQKRGISDANFHAAVTEESPLIERFAEMILESSKPKFPTYTLSINYDRSVADGIAAGKYDWVNSDITQDHFPSKRNDTAEVGVQLVHFERDMTTDDVLCELDKLGLRPAELPELLALGEKHPDLQREFPVVALGSRWLHSHGRWLVPALARHDAERALRLRWVDVGWGGIYRFAAVSK